VTDEGGTSRSGGGRSVAPVAPAVGLGAPATARSGASLPRFVPGTACPCSRSSS